MDGWMFTLTPSGWMGRWMDGWVDELTDRQVDERDGRKSRRADGPVARPSEGWGPDERTSGGQATSGTDGFTDARTCVQVDGQVSCPYDG